ncbi:DUF4194 domain-containing protein [Neorhizobium galegae]|jgi:hypothetical protein|uniref:Blr1989 protein n=1 Tax=Neorhizobium galegae bv. orientalis str. HAMBI 540 TaxID=1028800 RepID=A0A068SWC2_NEOGA|nr:DUF4194 domain-containing protein [Neorhizobium galegae]MCQ1855900.1 DUF4194 domain-containing protein [Neorhizobium galegae]CDN50071.1 Blr1989 protein [Neorhizobium galegae bv. orientalis str. HAMBI 540]
MLSEFEQVEATYGIDKAADLRKACRYLLRNQFAYSGDRGAATVYNTLIDNRFRRIIDGFFDSIGYRVHKNAEEQWVGILFDDDDPSSVPKMRLDETIVVLVLGSHWQEDADVGNLLDRATAVTTVNVLHERYRDMLQNTGKPAITAGRFLDLLKEVAVRNLISIGDFDYDAQDREVVIRPMIKFVSGADVLARLESYVTTEERGMRTRAMPAVGELLRADASAAKGDTP